MRTRSLLVPPLLALPLFACAPATNPGADAGTDPGQPDPAYFGLADERCLLFTDLYSIHVQANDVAITGKSVFTLTHNVQGFRRLVEYVEPVPEGLRLHRRDEYAVGGGNEVTIRRFTDAPLYLTQELSVGDPLETSTAALVEAPGAAQVQETNVLKTELLEELEVTAGGQPFQSQRIVFQVLKDDVAFRTDKLWFAPNHGLVKLDPHGNDLDEVTFTRVKVLDLEAPPGSSARFCIDD